jgi:uncharacterized membrane protein
MNLWLFRALNPWPLLALLVLPLLAWYTLRRPLALERWRRIFVLAIRCVILVLVVLALADVRRRHSVDRLAVFFVLDRSDSLSAAEQEDAHQAVRRMAAGIGKDDLAGLIVFAATPAVERPLEHPLQAPEIHAVLDGTQTDIAGALELALSAFPPGVQRRIVLVSDGRATAGDVAPAARAAAGAGVPVDVLPVEHGFTREIMIDKVSVPDRARVGDTVNARVVVVSSFDGQARLRAETGTPGPADARIVPLRRGKNVFEVERTIETPGSYVFSFRVEPVVADDDGRAENNVGYAVTTAAGPRRVLYVEGEAAGSEFLRRALDTHKIAYTACSPDAVPESPVAYQNYDAVILSNVPAYALGRARMETIANAVREYGTGLLMIGGPNSFGPGGYRSTPVEEVLPVDMDVRGKKAILNGALVLILHTCEFDPGNRWSVEICKSSIRSLGPTDFIGVVVYQFQGGCGWHIPLQRVGDPEVQIAKLSSITSGDMPDFSPGMDLAAKALGACPAGSRHMVIISDGDPSAPTSAVLQKLRAAQITASTVVIGPHSSRDVSTMKAVAAACGGRFYHAKQADQLPAVFAREAVTVRRSMIVERDDLRPVQRAEDPILRGLDIAAAPTLGGYVVTLAKESDLVRVPLAIVSRDEDGQQQVDPLLAWWQVGLGRAAVWTSDARNRWAARWVGWPGYGAFWSQLVRHVASSLREKDYAVSARVEGDEATLAVDAVDPDGRLVNFLGVAGRVLTPEGQSVPVAFRQTAPGRYEARIPIGRAGAYGLALAYRAAGGETQRQLAGFVVPPGEEYRAFRADPAALSAIAAATGGRVVDSPEAHNAFLRTGARVSVSGPARGLLLLIALLLIPLDVAARRIVIPTRRLERFSARLAAALRALVRRRAPAPATGTVQERLLRRKKAARTELPVTKRRAAEEPAKPLPGADEEPLIAPGPESAPPAETAPAQEEDQTMDHLLRARRRTRRRIDHEPPPDDDEPEDAP